MGYSEITLTDLFGESATQTDSTLTIRKSDLYGLTPSTTNTAESLLAAILLRASTLFSAYLIDENGNPIVSENNELIGYKNLEISERLEVLIWGKYLVTDGIYLTEVATLVATTFTDFPAWE